MIRKTPMSYEELHRKLQQYSSKNIDLVLKNNRSTYLSLKKERSSLKLNLHKGFLYASEEVCRAVVGYSLKDDPNSGKKLRLFSHQMFDMIENTQTPKAEMLETKGKYFDLQKIYDEVNRTYFNSKLQLYITWFNRPRYRSYRCITYGTYDRTLKLVRVNRILDKADVPKEYVAFIVYHEMLHEVCPAYIDKNGKRIVHTPLFKAKEKEFSHYKQVRLWEKRHGRS